MATVRKLRFLLSLAIGTAFPLSALIASYFKGGSQMSGDRVYFYAILINTPGIVVLGPLGRDMESLVHRPMLFLATVSAVMYTTGLYCLFSALGSCSRKVGPQAINVDLAHYPDA